MLVLLVSDPIEPLLGGQRQELLGAGTSPLPLGLDAGLQRRPVPVVGRCGSPDSVEDGVEVVPIRSGNAFAQLTPPRLKLLPTPRAQLKQVRQGERPGRPGCATPCRLLERDPASGARAWPIQTSIRPELFIADESRPIAPSTSYIGRGHLRHPRGNRITDSRRRQPPRHYCSGSVSPRR